VFCVLCRCRCRFRGVGFDGPPAPPPTDHPFAPFARVRTLLYRRWCLEITTDGRRLYWVNTVTGQDRPRSGKYIEVRMAARACPPPLPPRPAPRAKDAFPSSRARMHGHTRSARLLTRKTTRERLPYARTRAPHVPSPTCTCSRRAHAGPAGLRGRRVKKTRRRWGPPPHARGSLPEHQECVEGGRFQANEDAPPGSLPKQQQSNENAARVYSHARIPVQ
jgi:hypothetical protein